MQDLHYLKPLAHLCRHREDTTWHSARSVALRVQPLNPQYIPKTPSYRLRHRACCHNSKSTAIFQWACTGIPYDSQHSICHAVHTLSPKDQLVEQHVPVRMESSDSIPLCSLLSNLHHTSCHIPSR